MKFTRLQLRGLYDVMLPVVGALPTDKYLLKAADGFDPPEVAVQIARYRGGKGVYQGRQPQDREIVIKVGLNPDYGSDETVDDLREELYGLLTPPRHSDFVTVYVVDSRVPYPNTTRATTRAWVKRLEAVPFSEEPEVLITLSCLDPYLEYPFLKDYTPDGIQETLQIVNPGTAPTGTLLNVLFHGETPWFELQDSLGQRLLRVDHTFVNNEILHIDSRPGSQVIRSNVMGVPGTQNLASVLTTDSDWIELHGGSNVIIPVSPTTYWEWGAIQYRPQFWGI